MPHAQVCALQGTELVMHHTSSCKDAPSCARTATQVASLIHVLTVLGRDAQTRSDSLGRTAYHPLPAAPASPSEMPGPSALRMPPATCGGLGLGIQCQASPYIARFATLTHNVPQCLHQWRDRKAYSQYYK